jgi:hypothetical protein
MSTSPSNSKPTLAQLGGIKGLMRNPGLVLMTLRRGGYIGADQFQNHYYEQRRTASGARPRRWVVYAGAPDASTIGPEWHSWLHYTTNTVLPDSGTALFIIVVLELVGADIAATAQRHQH